MTEERRQVREGFVKGWNVDVGRFHEVSANAVDDRMGRLMGNDVVGQAGEDRLARQVFAGVGQTCPKIAEQDAVHLRIVEGGRLTEGVRVEVKEVRAVVNVALLVTRDAPVNASAERRLESLQRLRGD